MKLIGNVKFEPYVDPNNARLIRKLVTATIISEYALLQLVDNTKTDLKVRTKVAITSCRKVQEWFTTHNNADEEHKKMFRTQFNGNEIALLSELLELCMGVDEEGLVTIIEAVRIAVTPVENDKV